MSCKFNKVVIKKSTRTDKKYMAIFSMKKCQKCYKKTIHFGQLGYSDYTIHKNVKRRERYLKRHKKREDWGKCDTAGTLSKYILWGKYTSIQKCIKHYKNTFNLT